MPPPRYSLPRCHFLSPSAILPNSPSAQYFPFQQSSNVRSMSLTSLRFSFLVFVSLISANAQGLYWESKSTPISQSDQPPLIEKFYAAPKMFKVVQADGNEQIFRLDKQMIYQTGKEKKTYSEASFRQLE